MDISAKESYIFRQRNLLQDLVRRGTQVSNCSKLSSRMDALPKHVYTMGLPTDAEWLTKFLVRGLLSHENSSYLPR